MGLSKGGKLTQSKPGKQCKARRTQTESSESKQRQLKLGPAFRSIKENKKPRKKFLFLQLVASSLFASRPAQRGVVFGEAVPPAIPVSE